MLSLALSSAAAVRIGAGLHANANCRSDRSHDRTSCLPCARLRPSVSHRSSDTIVASATELSIHNPNISHAGRTALRHMGGAQQLSVALKADAALWESAILVLPRGALSASLLEIRAPASILRIE